LRAMRGCPLTGQYESLKSLDATISPQEAVIMKRAERAYDELAALMEKSRVW
jgi:hypothetical protein